MLKRFLCYFMLGCFVILAASCTTKNEPKEDTPIAKETPAVKKTPAPAETPPAKADPREVTILVDGMSERLKLT